VIQQVKPDEQPAVPARITVIAVYSDGSSAIHDIREPKHAMITAQYNPVSAGSDPEEYWSGAAHYTEMIIRVILGDKGDLQILSPDVKK
jgi:hypothetical protein